MGSLRLALTIKVQLLPRVRVY